MKRSEIKKIDMGGDSVEAGDKIIITEETENGTWVWGSGKTEEEAWADALRTAETAGVPAPDKDDCDIEEIEEDTGELE